VSDPSTDRGPALNVPAYRGDSASLKPVRCKLEKSPVPLVTIMSDAGLGRVDGPA
jgi:hypothetical protein